MTKRLSTSCPDADDLSWSDCHLPLTESKIWAILNNPNVTYKDCDALYFSLSNGDATLFNRFSDRVLAKQAEIVTR